MRKDSANNKSNYFEKEPPNLDSRSRRFTLERVFGEEKSRTFFCLDRKERVISRLPAPVYYASGGPSICLLQGLVLLCLIFGANCESEFILPHVNEVGPTPSDVPEPKMARSQKSQGNVGWRIALNGDFQCNSESRTTFVLFQHVENNVIRASSVRQLGKRPFFKRHKSTIQICGPLIPR